mgnify:FL=1
MKTGKHLFIVTYHDKNNVRHRAFVNHFTSIKNLENQYGKNLTISYFSNNSHVLDGESMQGLSSKIAIN